jgi:hypothetical protein
MQPTLPRCPGEQRNPPFLPIIYDFFNQSSEGHANTSGQG